MTMLEMSITYRAGAEVLRLRIRELRQARQRQSDPEEIFRLTRRIAELEPLLREARELAAVTAHYYERGYHKDEKYCF
ncbi:MAG: hypothetical protein VB060_11645 [Oscillibacter sp.]|uniref:hypothetical protein n=1 Tax=Oscillibacter sp. TaxID=1945593 RepID=UPI00289FBFE8|nr:hypothetical protein [Oscillibacter sp.]MEA4994452.1 hypothetical protein [Oscillibacter sp.]